MSVGYTGGRRSAAGGGGGGGRGGRRGAGGDGARRRHAGRPAGGGSPVRRMRRVGAWGPRRFVGDKRHTHRTNKIRLTGIDWKIVSTYEPKTMLTNLPA
eukprot:3615430-Pyramimonas_sp.AAC.1